MSNAETAPPQKQQTRIQLTKLYFDEPVNLRGFPGMGLAYEVDCGPQSSPGRQFFVAHFVPAWQVIELEWFRNENAKPTPPSNDYYRTRLTLALVKRFD